MISEKARGKGVNFERIMRITGYLSELDKFNTAKKHEVKDRTKHGVSSINKD